MHHARELMTTEVVLHMAQTLLEENQEGTDAGRWLEKFRILAVPQVNPDGNARVHAGTNMWRKNTWKDNNSITGVDLNRNYPSFWNYCNGSSGSKFSDTYRGPSPASEPETQAMMNLVDTFKPVVDISYHSYSELIIYPCGCAKETNPSADLFQSVGVSMNAKIQDDTGKVGNYKVGSAPQVIYEADGTDLDWQWKEKGVLAYTIEINGTRLGFQPDHNKWRDITVKRQEGGWRALLQRMESTGVRAVLAPELIGKITHYTLKKEVSPKNFINFAPDVAKKAFQPKGNSGLIYNVLENGNYAVEFYAQDSLVKEIKFSVSNELTDLGTINL